MTTLTVHGMSCDGCEEIVQDALEEVDGVETVETDREEDVAKIDGEAAPESLVEAVDFAGYDAELPDSGETDDEEE